MAAGWWETGFLQGEKGMGRFDFIAHIAVKDMDAMKKFIEEKLISLGVVGQMESLTVLSMIKRNHPPFPLEMEEDFGEENNENN